MEKKLIERLGRRIEFSALEISSKTEAIEKHLAVLVGIPSIPKKAVRQICKIGNELADIEKEVGELRGTLTWFKKRVVTESEEV